MKKYLILSFALFLIIVLTGCGQKSNDTSTTVKEPIFFYSPTCSHCQQVKDYINQNNIKSKVDFSEVQAFSGTGNKDLFNQKSSACGIPEEERGVPMIFDNGKCYLGSVEAIDFLKGKAGL